MSTPIVQARNLEMTYRNGDVETYALRGVDIEIQKGEMVAVMGPSGCGKTTLLNCLSGIDQATGGEINIEGTNLVDMNDNQKTKYRAENMGFIFQTFNLLPVLTSIENVELPLLVSGTDTKTARNKAQAALEAVGLGEYGHHKPAQLSGGQRQRVTVARSLVNEPYIVWADEPTGALDSETANEVMSLMTNLNKNQGLTILLVTHNREVAELSNRIINMKDGVISSEEIIN
ncbi:MAG: ABC transporter ATP-binding protein [Dehalococcoidia bacterium]|nr:ABC transporter ATP-binding protein [Dehalococcoidia bacterium]